MNWRPLSLQALVHLVDFIHSSFVHVTLKLPVIPPVVVEHSYIYSPGKTTRVFCDVRNSNQSD